MKEFCRFLRRAAPIAAYIVVIAGCSPPQTVSGVSEGNTSQGDRIATQFSSTAIPETLTYETPDLIENEPKQIVGEFPKDELSKFISENGLVPQVLPEGTSPLEYVQHGVNYLRKFRDALRDHPEHRGDPLSLYGINAPENIPIAIPQGWTIYEVIDAFLKEYDTGKIVVYENMKWKPSLGWSSNILYQDGSWKRIQSTITVGSDIKLQIRYHEPNNYFYSGTTDLHEALGILHEFSHGLQEQEILNILNSLITNDTISQDEAEMIITDSNRWSKFLSKYRERVINHVINFPPSKNQAQIESIKKALPSEAQATAVAFMMLYRLKSLNNSEYFPGAALYDIKFDEDMQRMQELYPGYWQNFYELFKSRVLETYNALDAEWLAEGTMREYPDQ